MTYQLIYLALTLVGFGFVISKHGQPKKEKHNIWVSLFSSGVVMFVLFKGGFFDCFL